MLDVVGFKILGKAILVHLRSSVQQGLIEAVPLLMRMKIGVKGKRHGAEFGRPAAIDGQADPALWCALGWDQARHKPSRQISRQGTPWSVNLLVHNGKHAVDRLASGM
jgi:hypothetical protein